MVKILECDKCHHLFKSTVPHMMVKLDTNRIINFCTDCMNRFGELAEVGLNLADLVEKYPDLQRMMKDDVRLIKWGDDE